MQVADREGFEPSELIRASLKRLFPVKYILQ